MAKQRGRNAPPGSDELLHELDAVLKVLEGRTLGDSTSLYERMRAVATSKLVAFGSEWLDTQLEFYTELVIFLKAIVSPSASAEQVDTEAFACIVETTLRRQASLAREHLTPRGMPRSPNGVSTQLCQHVLERQFAWNDTAVLAVVDLIAKRRSPAERHAFVAALVRHQGITRTSQKPVPGLFLLWSTVLLRCEKANRLLTEILRDALATVVVPVVGDEGYVDAEQAHVLEAGLGNGVLSEMDTRLSIVTPVYDTPPVLLRRCMESVKNQTYGRWEHCLFDDGSKASPRNEVSDLTAADSRFRWQRAETNKGIAVATNAAIAMARGEYICFLDHDDELAPFALEAVVRHLRLHPETDVLYSDEDRLAITGQRTQPFFKPAFSRELLRNCNYMCHFLVVRRSLLERVGGLRSGFDGAQDYDLVLRLSEATDRIAHLPYFLYHWRMAPNSTARRVESKPQATDAGRRALAEHLARTAVDGVVHSKLATQYWVAYAPKPSSCFLWATVEPTGPCALTVWRDGRLIEDARKPRSPVELLSVAIELDATALCITRSGVTFREGDPRHALCAAACVPHIGVFAPRLVFPDLTVALDGWHEDGNGEWTAPFQHMKLHPQWTRCGVSTWSRNYQVVSDYCYAVSLSLLEGVPAGTSWSALPSVACALAQRAGREVIVQPQWVAQLPDNECPAVPPPSRTRSDVVTGVATPSLAGRIG